MLNPSGIAFVTFTSNDRRHLLCTTEEYLFRNEGEDLRAEILKSFPDADEFDFVAGEEDEAQGGPRVYSWCRWNGNALFPNAKVLRLTQS